MEEPMTVEERAYRLQRSLEDAVTTIDILQARQARAVEFRHAANGMIIIIGVFALFLLGALLWRTNEADQLEDRVLRQSGQLQECRRELRAARRP